MDSILKETKQIAIDAGRIILDIYNSQFQNTIEKKSDDSPVTIADKKANAYIVEQLSALTPQLPIIAEESEEIPYELRKAFEEYWIVDPLDGTKEFIDGNGQFTVNIALMKNNVPVLGVVYVPTKDSLYWAAEGHGAYVSSKGETKQIFCNKEFDKKNIKVLLSGSHSHPKEKEYLKKFDNPVIERIGSSIKFMKIAEGYADVYFRFTMTKEWDIAASHIILKEAGGIIKNIDDNTEMKYGKPTLINPGLVVHSNNLII